MTRQEAIDNVVITKVDTRILELEALQRVLSNIDYIINQYNCDNTQYVKEFDNVLSETDYNSYSYEQFLRISKQLDFLTIIKKELEKKI